MSKSWRSTREYRIWRATCIRRDKVCVLCGSRIGRQVHHLDSGSYFPESRFDPNNGVTLCKLHHFTFFHILFMGSTRRKCTRSDFERFKRLYKLLS